MRPIDLTIDRIVVRNADPAVSADDLRVHVQQAVAQALAASALPSGRTARATVTIAAPALGRMDAGNLAGVVARAVASAVRPGGGRG